MEAKKLILGENKESTKVLMAVSDAPYVIGGKWKLMIILTMARGEQ